MTNRIPMAADDPRHGSENGYNNLACRCAPCTSAHTAYIRKWRKSRGNLRGKYRMARDAGYSSREAARRSHWSDPLREEG